MIKFVAHNVLPIDIDDIKNISGTQNNEVFLQNFTNELKLHGLECVPDSLVFVFKLDHDGYYLGFECYATPLGSN